MTMVLNSKEHGLEFALLLSTFRFGLIFLQKKREKESQRSPKSFPICMYLVLSRADSRAQIEHRLKKKFFLD